MRCGVIEMVAGRRYEHWLEALVSYTPDCLVDLGRVCLPMAPATLVFKCHGYKRWIDQGSHRTGIPNDANKSGWDHFCYQCTAGLPPADGVGGSASSGHPPWPVGGGSSSTEGDVWLHGVVGRHHRARLLGHNRLLPSVEMVHRRVTTSNCAGAYEGMDARKEGKEEAPAEEEPVDVEVVGERPQEDEPREEEPREEASEEGEAKEDDPRR